MLISHTKKFIYIKGVKVAGTSTEIAFQKFCQPADTPIASSADQLVCDEGVVGYRGANAKSKYWRNHLDPIQIKNKLNNEDLFNQYFKFGVIRNPFDRAVSLYHHDREEHKFRGFSQKISFAQFCHNLHGIPRDAAPWAWCSDLLYNFYRLDEVKIDYFIRFEGLQNDIEVVRNKLNINASDLNLGHYKKTRRPHYTEYYDDETRESVAQKYAKDLEYFGYEFGE